MQMGKEQYEDLQIDIIAFETEDIITASGVDNEELDE